MSLPRYSVRITPHAQDELRVIHRYIAAANPANAQRFTDELIERIRTLERLPHRGARALEGARKGIELRQILHGDYRIIYGVIHKTVWIFGVRHGRQLPSSL